MCLYGAILIDQLYLIGAACACGQGHDRRPAGRGLQASLDLVYVGKVR